MASPFKSKILIPTLFAHSNQTHRYLPLELPMTVEEKVSEKRRKELHNNLLAILQRKDDTKKQTLATSLQTTGKSPSFSSPYSIAKSHPKRKPKLTRAENPEILQIESMIDDIPQTAFEWIIEVE